MSRLPRHVVPYFRTQDFTDETVPERLLHDHVTRRGAWARLVVTDGYLRYVELDEEAPPVIVEAGQYVVIAPHVHHRVELLGPARFHLVFLRDEAKFPSVENFLARKAAQQPSAA